MRSPSPLKAHPPIAGISNSRGVRAGGSPSPRGIGVYGACPLLPRQPMPSSHLRRFVQRQCAITVQFSLHRHQIGLFLAWTAHEGVTTTGPLLDAGEAVSRCAAESMLRILRSM